MVKIRQAYPLLPNGAIDIKQWLEEIIHDYSEKDLTLLRAAAELAELYGVEVKTPLGESCLYQGWMMGEILQDLGLDAEAVATALLYPTYKNTKLSLEKIQTVLGEEVVKLIQGLEKIDILPTGHSQGQLENLRRMLLSIVEDVRVVLIKLASHTCEMRAATRLEEPLRRTMAEQTQEIYAPLANRLGIGQIKWELEDLSFRFLQPSEYKRIAQLLHERRIDREEYIDSVVKQITEALKSQDIDAEVSGRAKHIYSIWKKMQRKGIAYNEIYDLRAIRIVVQKISECYEALGTVHTLWQHIPKEFDDYIANPKSNGYRSLHTAVIGPEGRTLEVQIRTPDMHEQAELGIAAHWRYKENVTRDTYYESKLANLRQVLKWQEDWITDSETDEALKSEVFQDRVYVLTPKGAILDLAQNATVLDFAYHVHSEIGHRCRGAKVNGRMVPLTHTLKSGDRVEILTAKSGGPSRDWLNRDLGYLKTSRARTKAMQWFKKQDRDQNILDGRETLERELKRLGVENINFDTLARQLKINKTEDLLAGLGGGDIRISQILNAIQVLIPSLPVKHPPKAEANSRISKKTGNTDITVSGVGNLLTHMARCCKPVPGDEIIGYITMGQGVSVHRKDCINILQARQNKLNRLIQVEWGKVIQNHYLVKIVIRAFDREGLLRDISALLSSERINVVAMSTLTNKQENIADFKCTIEISGLESLSRVLHRIQQLPNIIEVKRIERD